MHHDTTAATDDAPMSLPDRVAAIATLAALKGVTPPDYAPAAGLTLHASSIDQKFGFDDGDTPDPVWDLLADYGIKSTLGIGGWWRRVLWDLVHAHLLPALDTHLSDHGHPPLPPLHYMEWTNHNPVRFAGDPKTVVLPEVIVHVPWLVVLAHAVLAVEAATAAKAAETAESAGA